MLELAIPIPQSSLPLGGLSELDLASFVVGFLRFLDTTAFNCWYLKSNVTQEAATVILFLE